MIPKTLDSNRQFFDSNIAKIQGIIDFCTGIFEPLAVKEDIFRSIIVMLHATLETMMRGVEFSFLLCKIDTNTKSIPLPDKLKKQKGKHDEQSGKMSFHFETLITNKDSIIKDFLIIQLSTYLQNESYTPKGIEKITQNYGIASAINNADQSKLISLINRRNRIVHNADLFDVNGELQITPITEDLAIDHFNFVKDFGGRILDQSITRLSQINANLRGDS